MPFNFLSQHVNRMVARFSFGYAGPACAKVVLISAIFAGCSSTQQSRRGQLVAQQAREQAVGGKSTLEGGDVLHVEVFGEKDLSGKFQVSDAGTIDYPLIGRVRVGGLAPPEVSELIRKRLSDGYLKEPHVRVLAEGYQGKKKIYVWGRVIKSGTFSFTSGMTVIEALTLAGGLSPLASKAGITVMRLQDGKKIKIAVPMDGGESATFRLRPGDVIFVPERVF